MHDFNFRLQQQFAAHEQLITRPNTPKADTNGVVQRWQHPVLTADHTPVFWRYDLDRQSNPYFLERLGVNATFNAGALYWHGRFLLVVRVEGSDRKSFFAVAESQTGVDNFRFWDYPVTLPETANPDTNVYDMRLVAHEDGFIYGIFCTERKAVDAHADVGAAEAQCGLVRTRDLVHWERLPDLKTPSGQQRNVVLHPERVAGGYGFYTRPQDGFVEVGAGGGIGWGVCENIRHPEIAHETVIDGRQYHTIKEAKNGLGPAPIKTAEGWLHLAHGVRNTAAGLRYVLYLFMTALDKPWLVSHTPGGYFLAPRGWERVGDVGNVLFCNGWLATPSGQVFIYYASSDTRIHVATSSIEQLLDYTKNTPPDGQRSAACVETRNALIRRNLALMQAKGLPGEQQK